MPTRARMTLWASFLLAVAGVGCGLAGWPPPIMFVCVGVAAVGLFVLMPWFIYRVPKPVGSMSLRLTQTGDDAIGVVRRALATIGWVETEDPTLTTPLVGVTGGPDNFIGAVAVAVVTVGVDAATVNARSVVAPPARRVGGKPPLPPAEGAPRRHPHHRPHLSCPRRLGLERHPRWDVDHP